MLHVPQQDLRHDPVNALMKLNKGRHRLSWIRGALALVWFKTEMGSKVFVVSKQEHVDMQN